MSIIGQVILWMTAVAFGVSLLIALVGLHERSKSDAERLLYAERRRHQVWKHQEVAGNQIRNVLRPLMLKMKAQGHDGAKFGMLDNIYNGTTTITCSDHEVVVVTITMRFQKEKVIKLSYYHDPPLEFDTTQEKIKEMLAEVALNIAVYFSK